MAGKNIVHIEIATHNREASGRFYQELFGWETRDMPEMNYTTFMSGSVGGGFTPLEPGDPTPPVLVYVDSDDPEADLARAEALGAKVIQRTLEIPTVGWFAIFEDPDGNRLALFKALMP